MLVVEVVDHVEYADAACVRQSVVHEVRRPGLVDVRRYRQRLRYLVHQPYASLDPQVQLGLTVDPIQALVVPAKASHIAHAQKAQASTPVAMVVGQAQQTIGNFPILNVSPGDITPVSLATLNAPHSSWIDMLRSCTVR